MGRRDRWSDAEQDVVDRLERAGATLLAMRVGGTWPAGYRSSWPDVVRDAGNYDPGARTAAARPSARDITQMDEAFGWVCLIPLDRPGKRDAGAWSRHGGAVLRRVVQMRALIHPETDRHIWPERRIADLLGCSHITVRSWHAKGIRMIAAALAGPPAPAA